MKRLIFIIASLLIVSMMSVDVNAQGLDVGKLKERLNSPKQPVPAKGANDKAPASKATKRAVKKSNPDRIEIVDTVIEPEATQVVWDADDHTLSVGNKVYQLVKVEGSSFMMGATGALEADASPEELPVHKVQITSFFMGNSEVPQWLWEAVMGDNPSKWKGEDLPVESVSWEDCLKFIKKLNGIVGDTNFRFPSEAEWEYAARNGRNGSQTPFSGSDDIDEVGWYSDNSNECTHPVMSLKKNALGLYDMTGNVLEWCCDYAALYTDGEQNNPRGPQEGEYKVARGGSWYGEPKDCRVSTRAFFAPTHSDDNIGFRLVTPN